MSSLFVKEANMFFRSQFQTQTCFETARAVWLLKPVVSLKIFSLYSFSLNYGIDSECSLKHVLGSYDKYNNLSV